MSYSSFTKSLLSSPGVAELYERATRNQFLELAGRGRLPRETLSQWLTQDRLYGQAYVRFIGGLISRVHLPKATDRPIAETLEWRVLTLLHNALTGIMAEMQFFEKTAGDYGLDLAVVGSEMEGEAVGFGPYKTTQGYIDLFDSFAAQPGAQPDKPLLEGLLVLWATEVAYLDAWSYAKSQSPQNPDPSRDLDGGALRKHFINNWTSDQFRAFVKEIEECLEALAARADDTEEVLLASSLSVLKRVLVLEEEFWPIVA
ncbi:hypothetical protein DL769_006148 [Monosporascus sp. CRB-8-3]|nr:hypothetical protein DL769_006148 [Monosporascus sp. CRB-8-3]